MSKSPKSLVLQKNYGIKTEFIRSVIPKKEPRIWNTFAADGSVFHMRGFTVLHYFCTLNFQYCNIGNNCKCLNFSGFVGAPFHFTKETEDSIWNAVYSNKINKLIKMPNTTICALVAVGLRNGSNIVQPVAVNGWPLKANFEN